MEVFCLNVVILFFNPFLLVSISCGDSNVLFIFLSFQIVVFLWSLSFTETKPEASLRVRNHVLEAETWG